MSFTRAINHFLFFPEQSSISESSGAVALQHVVAAGWAQHANILAHLKSLCSRVKHDKTMAKREAIIPNES